MRYKGEDHTPQYVILKIAEARGSLTLNFFNKVPEPEQHELINDFLVAVVLGYINITSGRLGLTTTGRTILDELEQDPTLY